MQIKGDEIRVRKCLGAALSAACVVFLISGLGRLALHSDIAHSQTAVPPPVNCSQSVGGNMSGQMTNCTFNIAPQKLAFSEALADKIMGHIPDTNKPIVITGIGSDDDQEIAHQFGDYLQQHGYKIDHYNRVGVISPPLSKPVVIRENDNNYILIIDPGVLQ